MKVHLTRRYGFSAAHRLHTPALSEEQNRATYGKCNNPYGHGHNYEIEVTVCGLVNEVTGRVMDLSLLDGIAEERVLRHFRHRNLNAELNFIPTTENLASEVLRRLRESWPPNTAQLEMVRIHETERNICQVENES